MAFEHIYRPQHKSDTEIVNDFVVRNALFDRLMFDIRKDGPGKLGQHHMVQGLRGMGKSTLFERIRVEMKEPELSECWLTVKTAEENWPVNSLLDFWIWIGQHMATVDPVGFGTLGDLGTLWNKDEQHEQCFTTIEARLRGTKKKLLMLVDNVGDLFRKFNKQENHALREILVSNKHIKLIGGTAVRLDELETHDAPYFDLFKEHHLAGLDQQEVIVLLGHYARKNGSKEVERVVKEEPHRVDHLRILTGGVPRTIMLLLDVFDKDGDTSVFDDLRRTLDLVTPLYKHRMDELSPQKQKIVHALAMQWDGMSAGEVASATRLESKVVSAQLGQLVREGFVLRDETSTKNHFYQLAERFFNIWYLMNNAQRNGAAKVRWLTRFFELWCDEKGLKERAMKHVSDLGSWRGSPDDQLLVTNALLGSGQLDISMKHQLYEGFARTFPAYSDHLIAKEQWLIVKEGSDWRKDVRMALWGNKPDAAELILTKFEKEPDVCTLNFRGDIALMRGNVKEARKAYRTALSISQKIVDQSPASEDSTRDLWTTCYNLVNLLLREGELTQARIAFEDGLRIFKRWVDRDPSNLQKQHALLFYYGKLISLLLREGELLKARTIHEEGHRIQTTLAERVPTDVEEQLNLALSHWGLFRLGELDEPIAENHYRAYVEIINDLAEKGTNAWKQGDLTNALSITAHLCGTPMYTGGVLNVLQWGLAREQYHGLRKFFEMQFPKLKTEMRPVYFALLRLMKDEDPDSHRRMGKELEEPVQQILARVEELRKELGQPSDTKWIKEKAKAPRKAAVKKKRPK